jgi:hypothetical protein
MGSTENSIPIVLLSFVVSAFPSCICYTDVFMEYAGHIKDAMSVRI